MNPRPRLLRLAPPAALSAVVLLAAFWARSPLLAPDPLAQGVPASLHLPLLYSVLAPMSDVFDTLTLLTIPQALATFAFAGALLFIWRTVRLARLHGLGLRRWHC